MRQERVDQLIGACVRRAHPPPVQVVAQHQQEGLLVIPVAGLALIPGIAGAAGAASAVLGRFVGPAGCAAIADVAVSDPEGMPSAIHGVSEALVAVVGRRQYVRVRGK